MGPAEARVESRSQAQGFDYVELLYRSMDVAAYYFSLIPQMIPRIKKKNKTKQCLLAVHVLRERHSSW